MRPGQHIKRGRNRNRHRGGGGGGNGNSANRVFDSNGPDVKLRGTAQTVAEKYMQLGRDAQASGDTVMAESYYQFADHYYRVWLAAQPVGQPIQFSRRLGEDESEEEGSEGGPEGEEELAGEAPAESGAGADASGDFADGAQPSGHGAEGQGQQGFQNRSRREFQQRDGKGEQNRDGGNRHRNRWGRRNERHGNDGPFNAEGEGSQDRGSRGDRQERESRPRHDSGSDQHDDGGNWEAPSFLKRPMAAMTAEGGEEAQQGEQQGRGRRPRGEPSPEDVPQGE